MVLLQPIWLLLLFPLGALHLAYAPPTRLLRVLRALVIVAIVLGLCRPALVLPSRHGTVVVAADRSASMPGDATEVETRVIRQIVEKMRSADRVGVVAFGERAAVEQAPQYGKFAGFTARVGADRSRLAAGLEKALALIPPRENGRILLISDGRWTGRDPSEVAARAAGRGIAVDTWTLSRKRVDDTAVARVAAPREVRARESFFISVWVRSPVSGEVSYRLTRGKTRIAQGTRSVSRGLTRLLFRDSAGESGVLAYEITVRGKGKDPVPENNTARFLVAVRGPRRVLVVSRSPGSGLADALRKAGLNVVLRRPEQCRWRVEDLGAAAAVVVENVPASDIGGAGMENLAAWTRETGGGLMFTGGKSAFGPGGYFKSPLDPLMPISMELRAEYRKLALAIVVALDRSGSMAMPAGGGKRKIDLADIGTVQVLDLLSDLDEFGVIAVDSSAHIIVNLAGVPEVRPQRSKILSIDSMGGGIFIYEALAASAAMLARAQAGARHIILFADAADSEHPADYVTLLDKCVKAGITVSVVGLGTPRDCDADLLRDIARRGNGNCYFTDTASELPRLFAQDTFTVARASFVEDSTRFRWTAGLVTLLGDPLPDPPALGGYNLCYLRPGATLAAISKDEYKAPIVAAWHAGLGRVLCYTGEADGKYTGAMGRWAHAGAFFAGLVRWTAGASGNLPEGVAATETLADGQLRVRLYLDPDREADPFRAAPRLRVLRIRSGRKPAAETRSFEWTSPDMLECRLSVAGGESILPAVLLGKRKPGVLPPVCLPYSPEFAAPRPGRGREALARIARISGGEERANPASVWAALPRKPRRVDVTPWWFLAALSFFLLEILQRRTGLLAAARRGARRKSTASAPGRTGASEARAAASRAKSRGWFRRRSPGRRHPAQTASTAESGDSAEIAFEGSGSGGEETGKRNEESSGSAPPSHAGNAGSGVLEAMRELRKRNRRQ